MEKEQNRSVQNFINTIRYTRYQMQSIQNTYRKQKSIYISICIYSHKTINLYKNKKE